MSIKVRRNIHKIGLVGLCSVIFPLVLFFDAYMVPGTNTTPIGTTIMLLLTVVVLWNGRLQLREKTDKLLLAYALYLILDQIVVLLRFPYIPVGTNMRQMVMNVLCILAIVAIPKYLNYKTFIKIYKFVVIVSCIGLLYQSVQVYVFHSETRMLVLPGLEGLLSSGSAGYIEYFYNRMRPSSFFTEPSAFSAYTIPMIIFALREKQYKLAVLVSVCNLLSTSTTGIFLSVSIWTFWLFFETGKKWIKCVAAIVFALAIAFIVQSTFFELAVGKILTTDITTNERTASGLTIFLQMPLIDKLTGVGLENVANYIFHQNIYMSSVDVTSEGYVTSGFGNFVKCGVIAGVLYLYTCIHMMFSKNRYVFLVAGLILVTSFTQTMSFNSFGMWWFVIYKILKQNPHIDEKLVLIERKR